MEVLDPVELVGFRDVSDILLEGFLDVDGRGGLKGFGGIAAVYDNSRMVECE